MDGLHCSNNSTSNVCPEWDDCVTGGLSSYSTPCVFVMNMISKVGLWVDGALVMVVVINALKKFKQFVNYGFVRKLVAELVYPVHKPTAITAFV